jgi:hypothetical protein
VNVVSPPRSCVASGTTPIPQSTACRGRRLSKPQRYSTASSWFEPLCTIRHNSSAVESSTVGATPTTTASQAGSSPVNLIPHPTLSGDEDQPFHPGLPRSLLLLAFSPHARAQMHIDCSTKSPARPSRACWKSSGLRLAVEDYEWPWYVDDAAVDGDLDLGMRHPSHRFCISDRAIYRERKIVLGKCGET